MAIAAASCARIGSMCVLRPVQNASQLLQRSLWSWLTVCGHASQGGGIAIYGGNVDIVSTSITSCMADVSAPEPPVRQL